MLFCQKNRISPSHPVAIQDRSSRFYLALLVQLIFTCFLLTQTGCVSGRSVVRKNVAGANVVEAAKPGTVYLGIASFYGEEFAGRTTSSGEIFSPYALTAAHPFLPMGTIISVTHVKNKKCVTVRINDRMPYHPDRILDLSKGAARELGMLQEGLAQVRIEVLRTE